MKRNPRTPEFRKDSRIEPRPDTRKPKYWVGSVPAFDDFGDKITDDFIDAPTRNGPWATMTPLSWGMNGLTPMLGIGLGQRYRKQANGKWLKVGG